MSVVKAFDDDMFEIRLYRAPGRSFPRTDVLVNSARSANLTNSNDSLKSTDSAESDASPRMRFFADKDKRTSSTASSWTEREKSCFKSCKRRRVRDHKKD